VGLAGPAVTSITTLLNVLERHMYWINFAQFTSFELLTPVNFLRHSTDQRDLADEADKPRHHSTRRTWRHCQSLSVALCVA